MATPPSVDRVSIAARRKRRRNLSTAVSSCLLAALLTFWVAACGDDTTAPAPPPPPPPPPVPSTVTVTPSAATLAALGDTVRFTVEVRDQDGRAMPGAAVAWTSSDASVATVDDSGLAMAVGNGTATITAASGAASGTATVTVEQSAASVAVSPDSVALAVGDTVRLSAEVRDQNGRAMPEAAVAWSSGDSTVASVDSAGLVRAEGAGAATVTAASGSAAGSASVSVEQSTSSVTVAPAEATISSGDTLRLAAEAFDANGLPVAGAVFSWSSSAPSVATVDDSGLVRGGQFGTATITAAAGAVEGTSEITVANPDRDVLVAFYEAAEGPNWVNSENWLTDAPLSEWYGVTTGPNGRVTVLNLGTNGATGTLTPELGKLSRLQELIVESMWLKGPIPPELGALSELRRLNLYRNLLTGPVPAELGRLRKLQHLHIDDNRLSGSIPSTLADLANLQSFYWDYNDGLCAPDTETFAAWRSGRDTRGPGCNDADRAALEHLFEHLDGANWVNSTGWGGDGILAGWHGIETDSLGRVEALNLADNGLAGTLPSRVSELTSMTALRLDGNPLLRGPIPVSLSRLDLRQLHYGGTDLCVPDDGDLRNWLEAIADRDGAIEDCPALSDRAVLVELYRATEGSRWTDNTNWLTDAPLAEWYGVEATEDETVTALHLTGNNLRGAIPWDIGQLEAVKWLDLDYNWLHGPISSALTKLGRLERLALQSNLLDGTIPPALGQLRTLQYLNLSDNQLTGPIPATLGSLTSLTDLWLEINSLDGPIPPELGNLSSLVHLFLAENQLEGTIPPELGRLTEMTVLWLHENRLTGSIPPELGDLAAVQWLYLGGNQLSGEIPPELGNLANVTSLGLDDNQLTGPIPAELGSLVNMGDELNLRSNQLSGPIPPELGNLVSLAKLRLGSNDLEGRVPPELGRMENLQWLDLSHNPKLDGPLPANFSDLGRLNWFEWTGTSLCVPNDDSVMRDRAAAWRVPLCDDEEVKGSMAYLTQAVQSLEYPVPLVAGEEALLRVFVTAPGSTDADIPDARATFFADGAEIHAVDLSGVPTPIPTDIAEAEASLDKSLNARIPAELVRPGLEMVVEIDPAGTLDPGLGVSPRIPESGRQAVPVEVMPPFNLTIVPFLWNAGPDSIAVELAEEMEADPMGHRLLWDTSNLLPVNELNVVAHDPVLSSSNNADALLDEVGAIRVLEGGSGYYMATMSGEATGAWGVAWIPGWTSYVRVGEVPQADDALTIAHELGHNLSLYHAPCIAGPPLDPVYPFPDGSTGAWGLDSRSGEDVLVPKTVADLMSYCVPAWIGDYHFTKAARFRRNEEAGASGPPTSTILLWGGADADGKPYLNPAFAASAPPAPPRSGGPYRIVGRAGDGRVLFSLDFDMTPVADTEGRLGFAYAVPVGGDAVRLLESITLSGPDGTATLDGDTNRPVVILRDRVSGRVRGLLRDLPGSVRTLAEAVAELGAGPNVEVLFSRGIPDVDPEP